MAFIRYRKTNGEIVAFIRSPNDLIDSYIDGDYNAMLIIDTDTSPILGDKYVYDNEITIRPTQTTTINKSTITADGIDAVLITDAPVGIFTAINKATEETITGEISGSDTFATTIAGTYKITITAFPFLDFTATIEAI